MWVGDQGTRTCRIRGALPGAFAKKSTALTKLVIRGCQMEGGLPAHTQLPPNLEYLDMSADTLTGEASRTVITVMVVAWPGAAIPQARAIRGSASDRAGQLKRQPASLDSQRRGEGAKNADTGRGQEAQHGANYLDNRDCLHGPCGAHALLEST